MVELALRMSSLSVLDGPCPMIVADPTVIPVGPNMSEEVGNCEGLIAVISHTRGVWLAKDGPGFRRGTTDSCIEHESCVQRNLEPACVRMCQGFVRLTFGKSRTMRQPCRLTHHPSHTGAEQLVMLGENRTCAAKQPSRRSGSGSSGGSSRRHRNSKQVCKGRRKVDRKKRKEQVGT